MILITGGAWQGKREYAYGLMDTDSDKKLIIEGGRCSLDDMKRVQIVDQLHLWIKRKMEELLPQLSGGSVGGMGSTTDGGWDERVFDQQEMLLAQEKIWQELKEVMAENPDVIFIVNELGCGVIPMDVFDRRYREIVGRTCCDLAKEAREVYRVVCGVGTLIKKTEDSANEENNQTSDADQAADGGESAEASPADGDGQDVQDNPENTSEEK